jgi:hypothetical protein
MSGAEFDVVRLFISVTEAQRISSQQHMVLDRDESRPTGHILLECEGHRRRWVTTDGTQLMVIEDEGPVVEGLGDEQARVEVLVNPRFFRSLIPEDLFLEVRQHDGQRMLTLFGDGYAMSLPEHPGPFADWRGVLASVAGTEVVVDSHLLYQACLTAGLVPLGLDHRGKVLTALYGSDGKLVVHTAWQGAPDSMLVLTAEGEVPDTEPVLVSPARLQALISAVDLPFLHLTLPTMPGGSLGIQAGHYRAVLRPVDRWRTQRRKLETLLCEFLRVESMTADHDGDYLVEVSDGIRMFVRLQPDVSPLSVQVFSVLASDVAESPGLMSELNSLNSVTPYVKMMYAAGAIMAEVDLVAEDLGQAELVNALQVVRTTSENYRHVLSSFFGSPEQL